MLLARKLKCYLIFLYMRNKRFMNFATLNFWIYFSPSDHRVEKYLYYLLSTLIYVHCNLGTIVI